MLLLTQKYGGSKYSIFHLLSSNHKTGMRSGFDVKASAQWAESGGQVDIRLSERIF